MGKQGPCYHCGITTTPLWRNGPPEKPVLCNACGSRWRTKGTLVNYMPMHSGGCGMMRSDSSDKLFQGKGSKCKEQRSHKRKKPCKVYANIEHGIQRPDLYHSRGLDDDISIRSTGSEISCSEGCTQRIAHGGRNFLVFWSLWDCHIPSKKRTPFCRRQLSSSKLSKLQLLFDGRETSTLGSSEASLPVEYKTPSTAVEIGLGGVFIRPPIPIQEQESVSSSLFFESKEHDYSSSSKQDAWKAKNLPIQFTRGVSKPLFQGEEKMNQERRSMEARCSDSPVHSKQIMKTFLDKRYNPLLTYYSPLGFLDLKDIVNVDIFMKLLTRQEQSQLTKLTSSADVSMTEESLKEMFNSSQFEAALANFQLLLSKGMFNFTLSGICGRNLPLYLQLLEVTNLTTSGWMEQWSHIANHSKYNYSSGIQSKEYLTKNVQKGRTKERNITNVLQISNMSKNMVEKRLPNRPLGHAMAGESGQNSYALQSLTSPSSVASKTLQSGKVIRKKDLSKDPISLSKNRSCITADSLYLSTSNKDYSEHYNSMSALMNDLAESDLLLDVPSSMSFQQAELLPQSVWSRNQPANNIDQDCNASLTGSMPVANTLQKEKSPD